MAPRNVRVWNEDLLKALHARQEQCQRQGRQQQYQWRDGHTAIQAVRKDIYMFSTGRIVNLPTGLKKSVQKLCEDIIHEREPILPPGYVPTNASDAAQMQGNPFEQDPYLKKIKARGGAFAILMAFHHSYSKTLSRHVICEQGAAYCDEEMEPNYHAGRPYGAFSSMKTLKSHGLVTQNSTARRMGTGFRSDGEHSYTLTQDGELFIQALIKKFPDATGAAGVDGAAFGGFSGTGGYDDLPSTQSNLSHMPAYQTESVARSTPITVKHVSQEHADGMPQKSRKRSQLMIKDEQALRHWLGSAQTMSQKTFVVGKERRKYLHGLCERLETERPGLKLLHESHGDGPNKTLYVTITAQSSDNGINPRSSSPSKRPAPFAITSVERLKQSRGEAHATETKPSAKRKLFSSTNTATTQDSVIDLLSSDSEDEEECKSTHKPKVVKPEVICLDDDEQPSRVSYKAKAKSRQATKRVDLDNDSSETDEELEELLNYRPFENEKKPPKVKLTAQQCLSELCTMPERRPQMTILVDSRERNRNATPRHLRIQLQESLSSGALKAIWPEGILPVAQTEERSLSYGDFAYVFNTESGEERLGVVVERKRIGDLVQRSVKGDHWKQLGRMRDCCPHSILLIEYKIRAASDFEAFGSQDLERWDPWNTVIEDDHAVYRMMGRALLSSNRIKFAQARDEQGSLRIIAALGLMSAISPSICENIPESVPQADKAQATLLNRLKVAGVPWELAKRVSREMGSTEQLDLLYAECESDKCRSALLQPLLFDIELDDMSGSAASWSNAIYHAYFSTDNGNSFSRSHAMNQFKDLVEDHGMLLNALHTHDSAEAALESVLNGAQACPHPLLSRVVTVELHKDQLQSCFPDYVDVAESGTAKFKFRLLESNPLGLSLPTVALRTTSGNLSSSRLFVHILEASAIVEVISQTLRLSKGSFVDAAKKVALTVNRLCDHQQIKRGRDRRVLLLRGLDPALSAAAKQPGYRPQLRIVVDLVLAELMVSHEVVVIQAVRLKGDVELIMRQLIFACLHYHLLIEEDD